MPIGDTIAVDAEEWRATCEEVKRLRAALEQIRIASEFHAQDGVADYVMRYAHESTKRLCDEALKKDARLEGDE